MTITLEIGPGLLTLLFCITGITAFFTYAYLEKKLNG